MRSRHGRAISYQLLGTFGLGKEFFCRAFARLTPYWGHLDVPCGCYVERPPVFSYRMRELCDRESPWWVATYTELAVKTAEFILFDVYDWCRLWSLSREMIEGIQRLNSETIFGNEGNER